jgi:hypothetical protein
MTEASRASNRPLQAWLNRNRVSSSSRKCTRMRNRPRGCRSASSSRLFTRVESAGSMGGLPKSSSPVPRLASAHSASLCNNHSRRLRRSPRVFHRVAHEPKLRGSNFRGCSISDICIRLPGSRCLPLRTVWVQDCGAPLSWHGGPIPYPGRKHNNLHRALLLYLSTMEAARRKQIDLGRARKPSPARGVKLTRATSHRAVAHSHREPTLS